MNRRSDSEIFENQPFLSEEEEQEARDSRRRRGSTQKSTVRRKATANRKALTGSKALVGLKLDKKPRPRPWTPIKFPIFPLPLTVWNGPLSTPVPAKPEPPQSSTPGGTPSAPGSTSTQPADSDQPREGNEYMRWVQMTLNSLLNLNLRTDGVVDVET